MDLTAQLRAMRQVVPTASREEAILQTMEKAKEIYWQQLPPCSGWEFLWSQLCLMRKRWWLLQASVLALALLLLPYMEDSPVQVRSLGIIGCLFVILIIPELWRNKNSDSIQVEAACLYSLRHIYAARFTLIGIVDIFLLTLFCFGLHRCLGMDFPELVQQLLLPVTITAGICFQTLGSSRNYRDSICLIFCLGWCLIWWYLTANQAVYSRIAPGLWAALFFLALAFLFAAVQRTLRTTNQSWEVIFS